VREKEMNCKEICELLIAYLDGEVTPEEKTNIETHLHGCRHCRAELDALSATQKNLRSVMKSMADEVSPSTQAWEKVKARLKTKGSWLDGLRKLFTDNKMWQVAKVTVAIFIIAAVVLIWQYGGFGGISQAPPPAPAPAPSVIPTPTSPAPTPVPSPTPRPGISIAMEFDSIPVITSPYGEEVEIKLSFTNQASEPRIMTPFPPEIKIIELPDIQPPDSVVRAFPAGNNELELQPGESASCLLKWDQKDDSGQQVPPGWYGVEATVASRRLTEKEGGSIKGLAAKILILPPQGVMEKTIEVNQSQTVTGLPFTWGREEQKITVTITLERVEMTADSVRFTVLVTSADYSLPQGPELAPPQWLLEAYALYTVDGITKDAGVAGMRPLEDGLQLHWGYEPEYIDPIPSDAKELTFTITKLGDWEGPWEFKIPLE
jgi:hypothetical protein